MWSDYFLHMLGNKKKVKRVPGAFFKRSNFEAFSVRAFSKLKSIQTNLILLYQINAVSDRVNQNHWKLEKKGKFWNTDTLVIQDMTGFSALWLEYTKKWIEIK